MKKIKSLIKKSSLFSLTIIFLIGVTPNEIRLAIAQDRLLDETEVDRIFIDLEDENLEDFGLIWQLADEGDFYRLYINEGSITDGPTESNVMPLSGAKFSLYEWNDASSDWESEPKIMVESGADGHVSFSGLIVGRSYQLIEIHAPDDYVRPTGYWIIHVSIEGVITIETVGENQPDFFDRAGHLYLPNEPEYEKSPEDEYALGYEGEGSESEDEYRAGDKENQESAYGRAIWSSRIDQQYEGESLEHESLVCVEGQTWVILPSDVNPSDIEIEATSGWNYAFILTDTGHYIITIDPPEIGLVATDEVIITFPIGVVPDDVMICLADSSLTYEINTISEPDGSIVIKPSDEVNRERNGNDQNSLSQTKISVVNKILFLVGLIGLVLGLSIKRIRLRILKNIFSKK